MWKNFATLHSNGLLMELLQKDTKKDVADWCLCSLTILIIHGKLSASMVMTQSRVMVSTLSLSWKWRPQADTHSIRDIFFLQV